MRSISKLSLTFLATVALSIAASIAVGFASRFVPIPLYVQIVITQVCAWLPGYLYLRREGLTYHKMADHKNMARGSILICILIMITAMPMLSFLNYVSSLFAGSATEGLMNEIGRMPFFTNALFIAALPAYNEEAIFRGLYYRSFRKSGFWIAALTSALLFGLMHLNWNQFSYAFVLGILLCAVMEATGSINAARVIHFCINLLSVWANAVLSSAELTAVVTESRVQEPMIPEAVGGMLTAGVLGMAAVIGGCLTILLVWLLAKLNNRDGYMVWMMFGGEKRYLVTQKRVRIWSNPVFVGVVAVTVAVVAVLSLL